MKAMLVAETAGSLSMRVSRVLGNADAESESSDAAIDTTTEKIRTFRNASFK